MYFPYLRAKQNELLAIRELLENELLSDRVVPIIEPIKETATFIKTLSLFKEKGKEIFTIINPKVGHYMKYENDHPIFQNKIELKRDALLMQDQNLDEYVTTIKKSDEFLVIFKETDDLKNYKVLEDFNLIPRSVLITKNRFRRQLGKINDFILLNDPFEKELRNADYLENDDKFFSDDHLFYVDEGFSGFSDYSIIGADYIDSGFAPRAVAIHILYLDEQKSLRIKHFVSDSNDNIANPAGKFSEALSKLVYWYNNTATEVNKTNSLKEFITLFDQSRYPGLGYVKKLSIKHHLELVGRFMDS